MEKKYSEKAKVRLDHIRYHLNEGYDVDQIVGLIKSGSGDVRSCVNSLSLHALASAMWSWFENSDIQGFKKWLSISGQLRKYSYGIKTDSLGALGKQVQLLAPLLSDDHGLVKWFSEENDSAFNLSKAESPKHIDFVVYQVILAIRGEWDKLKERCEIFLASPPTSLRKYVPDLEFYSALASGETDKMSEAIEVMVSPKFLSSRADSENGYTDGLISTFAVIYSKIAWMHGFQVNVKSPYVPQEWLPIIPLDNYGLCYDFLNK
ncbi:MULTISPECIES: immunity 49 family protein [Pseudomonas]|uniref:immunity 49 family protein n=1 Tax=Pseudomonas TaxID=286 RepID=UPI0007C452C0|nr:MULTISPECIES: immunity 49 family protein [unclassified Pseudomonas]SFW90237.1 Immunity protein 49 [Pseudomonas sp. NFACC10-1]